MSNALVRVGKIAIYRYGICSMSEGKYTGPLLHALLHACRYRDEEWDRTLRRL